MFLKRFYSIAPFSLSTRRFRPPSLIKQTQGSRFKEFYLKKVLNSWTKPLKSWTKSLYYHANITFRIRVKIIQVYGVGAPELGTLPGAGVQIKNQKEPDPEFSWKFRTRAGVIAIWEVPSGPFLDTNGFAK